MHAGGCMGIKKVYWNVP